MASGEEVEEIWEGIRTERGSAALTFEDSLDSESPWTVLSNYPLPQ